MIKFANPINDELSQKSNNCESEQNKYEHENALKTLNMNVD